MNLVCPSITLAPKYLVFPYIITIRQMLLGSLSRDIDWQHSWYAFNLAMFDEKDACWISINSILSHNMELDDNSTIFFHDGLWYFPLYPGFIPFHSDGDIIFISTLNDLLAHPFTMFPLLTIVWRIVSLCGCQAWICICAVCCADNYSYIFCQIVNYSFDVIS